MDQDPDGQRQSHEDLEREIRLGRKFNPQEALARMAGPGAMKGASPVSPIQQAETEVGSWLAANLPDPGGALKVVLHRHLKGSRLLLDRLDRPVSAIAEYCRAIMASDTRLGEIVREADVEWGRAMDERPYFEGDAPPDPDDPYTVDKVRRTLAEVLEKLPGGAG